MFGDDSSDSVSVYCRRCDKKWDWDTLEGPNCPDCHKTICTKGLETDTPSGSSQSRSGADSDDDDDDEQLTEEERWEKFYEDMASVDVDGGAPFVPDVSDKNEPRE